MNYYYRFLYHIYIYIQLKKKVNEAKRSTSPILYIESYTDISIHLESQYARSSSRTCVHSPSSTELRIPDLIEDYLGGGEETEDDPEQNHQRDDPNPHRADEPFSPCEGAP